VLLGIPSLFIGLFGAIGVITGEKLVAGTFGAVWAYLATVGAYELNRRKFAWARGRKYSDRHLLAGTLAASTSLVISGAMNETMPALVIVPALSAIMQANVGHEKKYLALIHAAVLVAGIGAGFWFYANGMIGKVLLETVAAMP
jgi:hypothetical protein